MTTSRRCVVLFLCTGNSCRSQMAEGWGRALLGDLIECCSAGIETHGLNPRAVAVMQEAGVDISQHQSQKLDEFDLSKIDLVLTVCSHADRTCPTLPAGVKVVHVGFDDPPALAKGLSGQAELDVYRRVRDDIRRFVEQQLPALLAL